MEVGLLDFPTLILTLKVTDSLLFLTIYKLKQNFTDDKDSKHNERSVCLLLVQYIIQFKRQPALFWSLRGMLRFLIVLFWEKYLSGQSNLK